MLHVSSTHQDGHWQAISLSDHSFLSPLAPLFPESVELEAFALNEGKIDRLSCQGMVAVVGKIGGQKVGVLFNDFRVNGGSFNIANSQKANAFIAHLTKEEIPLVMVFNTIGVGIMEGRKVFMDSFGTMPSLFDFREKNLPLITVAIGRCLGLGAILFQMGHYRISVREKNSFNLTGPEVIRLFFGGQTNFDALSSGERQFEKNDIVQELADSPEAALAKAHALLYHWLTEGEEAPFSTQVVSFPGAIPIGEYINGNQLNESETKLFRLLKHVGDSALEVYEQLSPVVRTFLVRRGSRTVGVFANPPGHPNNLITVAALERYNAALGLFKAMGVPIISFLDTPGIDPRFEHQDDDIVRLIVSVGKRIIQYPHGHMGFLVGRCFGGATTLAFPKNFRSLRNVAVKGCQVGVMGESILEQILESSPRLLEIRREVRKTEKEDFSDLIETGMLDAVVEESEIGREVQVFLNMVDMGITHELLEHHAVGASVKDYFSISPEERKPPSPPRPQPAAARERPWMRPRLRSGAKERSPRSLPKYSR